VLTSAYEIRNFITGKTKEMLAPVLRHLCSIRTPILVLNHLLVVCLSYVLVFLRHLFRGAIAPSGPGPSIFRCFTITLRLITFGRTPLDVRSSRRRYLYLTIHKSHKKDVNATGGLRSRNLSKRAAADSYIRTRGHWELSPVYRPKFCVYFSHRHMCCGIRSPLCQVI
jgi:hypothetical protein